MPSRTRVFISYTHDSAEHQQFVLELTERLLEDGFNCILDFYLDEAPAEGWQAWLEAELVAADFTLVIGTPTYLQRYQNNQVVDTNTSEFAGLVITQDIYIRFAKQTKFVPILPPDSKLQAIIPPLQGQNAFELMTDYLGLHQLLRNKPLKMARAEKQPTTWESENITTQSVKNAEEQTKPTTKIVGNYIVLIMLAVIALITIIWAVLN